MEEVPPSAPLLSLVVWAFCTQAAAAQYVKDYSYVGWDFFSHWTFDEGPDPTRGHVTYVDRQIAAQEGFVNATADRVFIGADRTTRTGGSGRRSVRLRSTATYDSGLFMIALDHMPTGCATWPAFWMFGEEPSNPWPEMGEYDIIEGVHEDDRVSTTLHTREGCEQQSVAPGEDMTGRWVPGSWKEAADDCYVHADGQFINQGCIQEGPPHSIGPMFNARGGGTYAAEWAPQDGYIRTWFWPAGSEPEDTQAEEPDPRSWGKPYSFFRIGEQCSKDHFRKMRLVFDLSFCGDWAGGTYQEACPERSATMTCEDFVSDHPEAFQEAYWSVRKLEVYQWKGVHSISDGEDSYGAGRTTHLRAPQEGEGKEEGSGGGISWWHVMISLALTCQSCVLCGIGFFLYRLFRGDKDEDPKKESVAGANTVHTPRMFSNPPSPIRPLVLSPSVAQQAQGHPALHGTVGQSRMMARALSAPTRLAPEIVLSAWSPPGHGSNS